jgi:ornithine cyclodeaminase/alanine dehydrogenase-like protein (mu-crystallin family)
MSSFRILREQDVRDTINAGGALEMARRTLRDQATGGSRLSTPSAMTLDALALGGPRFKFKAATVAHLNASGIRLLSNPGTTDKQTRNYCAVYDHSDFHLAGLVAENWLSKIRTAAFGVVAVEQLVNPGPLVVALYGTGGIAAEIIAMLACALPVAELRVHSRRPESMAAFVNTHAPVAGYALRAEPDRARAASDADLVITLTESPSPLIFPGETKDGCVVCSMGSYNEVDYGVLLESARLIVDDADFSAEMGDGRAWIAQGHLSRAQFNTRIDALACEVITGQKPGRQAASERIVALIQGMAIGDVAFATHALREAERLGRGQLIELD